MENTVRLTLIKHSKTKWQNLKPGHLKMLRRERQADASQVLQDSGYQGEADSE